MTPATLTPGTAETLADLLDRLGSIPPERIRLRPPPQFKHLRRPGELLGVEVDLAQQLDYFRLRVVAVHRGLQQVAGLLGVAAPQVQPGQHV